MMKEADVVEPYAMTLPEPCPNPVENGFRLLYPGMGYADHVQAVNDHGDGDGRQ